MIIYSNHSQITLICELYLFIRYVISIEYHNDILLKWHAYLYFLFLYYSDIVDSNAYMRPDCSTYTIIFVVLYNLSVRANEISYYLTGLMFITCYILNYNIK